MTTSIGCAPTRHLRTLRAALTLAVSLAAPASADFTDTAWRITAFTGEAIFIDPEEVIGETQSFDRGYAEGAFFQCDFAGLSKSYTSYDETAFFGNPEFERFAPLRDAMTEASATLFVHRVTCAGSGDPADRRVLYPFLTNETRRHAWYLFENGVFSMSAP